MKFCFRILIPDIFRKSLKVMRKENSNNSIHDAEAKVMRKYQFHLTRCHSKNSVFDNLFILKLDIFFHFTLFTTL